MYLLKKETRQKKSIRIIFVCLHLEQTQLINVINQLQIIHLLLNNKCEHIDFSFLYFKLIHIKVVYLFNINYSYQSINIYCIFRSFLFILLLLCTYKSYLLFFC